MPCRTRTDCLVGHAEVPENIGSVAWHRCRIPAVNLFEITRHRGFHVQTLGVDHCTYHHSGRRCLWRSPRSRRRPDGEPHDRRAQAQPAFRHERQLDYGSGGGDESRAETRDFSLCHLLDHPHWVEGSSVPARHSLVRHVAARNYAHRGDDALHSSRHARWDLSRHRQGRDVEIGARHQRRHKKRRPRCTQLIPCLDRDVDGWLRGRRLR